MFFPFRLPTSPANVSPDETKISLFESSSRTKISNSSHTKPEFLTSSNNSSKQSQQTIFNWPHQSAFRSVIYRIHRLRQFFSHSPLKLSKYFGPLAKSFTIMKQFPHKLPNCNRSFIVKDICGFFFNNILKHLIFSFICYHQ
jgi:hypothetical protein